MGSAWLYAVHAGPASPPVAHDPVTGLFEPMITDLGRRAVPISYPSVT